MDIEIHVSDTVKIVDNLPQVIEYVTKVVQEWFENSDEEKITITLVKQGERAPPALGIHTQEIIKSGESLG